MNIKNNLKFFRLNSLENDLKYYLNILSCFKNYLNTPLFLYIRKEYN